MTKTLFPPQTFVGFEHLLNELDFIGRHANDNYPPHNVVKVDEGEYLIELAVSGFKKDEIEIEQKEELCRLLVNMRSVIVNMSIKASQLNSSKTIPTIRVRRSKRCFSQGWNPVS